MADETQIDKLRLDISVNSSQANVNKIEKLSESLDRLSSVLKGFPSLAIYGVSEKITRLGTAFASIAAGNKQITSLGTRLTNLNKKISQLDVSTMDSKFAQMTKSITPFIDKLNSAQTALVALNGVISGSGKIKENKVRTPNAKNGILNVAKWTSIFVFARKLFSVMADISQSGAEYTETLNLWEVAMGDNINVATDFVNKMNEAYGISEKTLMNAQAIFKNMLGSLGEISDQTAYRLSEGITQMALDYASLYNQSFEQAFTKFQAALAGQVRPIRSVAGYDITENTLYQLYQSLGGTKTMRQLSRTEKQLLSILAIFNQMTASGAVGDLAKTMESFANQSRVMTEAWQQTMSYAGVLLTYLIQESGILTYVNGVLIFISDVLKAVAEDIGAIQRFADPFAGTTEGALEAGDAIDEVQGKLLGFDKFQALSGTQENAFSLDEKLVAALSGFDSILSNASMAATNVANSLKKASGLFNEDGIFDRDSWDKLIAKVKMFSVILTGTLIAYKLSKISTDTEGVSALTKALTFLKTPLGIIVTLLGYLFVTNEEFRESVFLIVKALAKPLNTILNLITTIVNALTPIIQVIGDIIAFVIKLLDNIGLLEPVLYTILTMVAISKIKAYITTLGGLGIVIVEGIIGALMKLEQTQMKISSWADSFIKSLKKVNKQALLTKAVGISGLVVGIMGLFYIFQNWDSLSGWQKVVGLLGSVAAAALGAAMAFGAFHSAWSMGLATAGIIAGIAAIAAVIATSKSEIENMEVPMFANGGLPNKGSMFIAGEAGPELVTNMGGGQSGVMNMEQLENAVARGILVGLSSIDLRDDRPINVNIDGQRFFTASRDIYQRNGYDVSRVR